MRSDSLTVSIGVYLWFLLSVPLEFQLDHSVELIRGAAWN